MVLEAAARSLLEFSVTNNLPRARATATILMMDVAAKICRG